MLVFLFSPIVFLFSANIEFLSILVEATLNKINTTLKNHIEYISSKEIQENHKLNFNVHIIYLNLFFPQKNGVLPVLIAPYSVNRADTD